MHNGGARSGIASATYKHGRYSKVAPARYLAQIERSLADPELLSVKPDLALLDSRCAELIELLNSDDALTNLELWSDIREWMDARRKLSETEQKRQLAMQTIITAAKFNQILQGILDAVRRHVTDRDTLAKLQDDINRTVVILVQ
jgi:hypothetical protein